MHFCVFTDMNFYLFWVLLSLATIIQDQDDATYKSLIITITMRLWELSQQTKEIYDFNI